MTNRVEALLDSIGHVKGMANPDSITYQIKNPLHIRSFSRPGKHEIDAEGRRVFTSWLAGYKASLFDLELKVSGKSRSGLREWDNLSNLLKIYGLTEKLGQQQVVKYLKRALLDDTLHIETPLAYFRNDNITALENKHNSVVRGLPENGR